ncbi:IS66-like element accessory protein TnpA [Paraburkholderia adhaesiva]|uniref:IS66-like element accessory protein TnpA n=1 Tax=Paraburkholderia adhaesiva TaxID=2883244 RepID=UPI001F1873C8|nr:transposase [Paraburkholderia adhaesiva]
MTDKHAELGVVRLTRDGRRRYDEGAKRALIEMALRPGVSVARLAQEHGINANLLRKWITKYLMQREAAVAGSQESRAVEMIDGVSIDMPVREPANAPAPAFVPVVTVPSQPPVLAREPLRSVPAPAAALHVCLPNGIEFNLGEASLEELTAVIQMLGSCRVPV